MDQEIFYLRHHGSPREKLSSLPILNEYYLNKDFCIYKMRIIPNIVYQYLNILKDIILSSHLFFFNGYCIIPFIIIIS